MPKILANDSGTLREMRKVFINDSGTLRDIKKVFINDSGTLRQVFPSAPDLSLVWTTASASLHGRSFNVPCKGFIRFNLDGTTFAGVDGERVDTLTGQNWHSLAPSVQAGADTWTVKIDAVSVPKPHFVNLQEGVEYTMDEFRQFNLENQRNSEGIYTLQITFNDHAGKIIAKSLSLWMPAGIQP